jgi:serine/threonine protein kinase
LGNRYQILEKLGQGGMGEVYKALDTRTERFVAIKQVRSSIASDATVIERFRREGQALSDLNHPNIVKMLDMIQQNDEYFLVTEFIEGGDLAGYLQEVGKLPLEVALKMGLELADALSRAHHLGIIHRDIKPANVLIAKDGTPRLTDFGVAHVASQERLTGTGMAVGTMDYLPPEAVNGEAVDVRADLWSFGVMLYEMLTGLRPFTGATTISLLSNILMVEAEDIRLYCPEASPELNELIHQMLQKERNNRIRSARQVGATLEAILQGDISALSRLQTPNKESDRKTKPLEDLPTTPGMPIPLTLEQAKQQGVSDYEVEVIDEPSPLRSIAILLLVGIVVIGLIAGGVFFAFNQTAAEPTITPSPEPTATAAPIFGDAPVGYRWDNLDELTFLVPTGWTYVAPQMMTSLMSELDTNSAEVDALMTMFEQQRAYNMYVDFTTLASLVVMVEDIGIELPDLGLMQRVESLATVNGSMPIEDSAVLDLPIGRTFYMGNDIPPSNSNTESTRQEVYNFYRGTTLYSVIFGTRSEQFESFRESINTVLASVQIEENAEAAPESTESAPAGYRWRTVDELLFPVPTTWVTVPLDTMLPIITPFI